MNFDDFARSIVSSDLRAVAAHWCEARGATRMPSWEQLRPSEMSAQMSLLWAFKYDRETGRFTGRLASNRITLGFGKSFRGLPLEEVHPADTFAWIQQYMTRIVLEPTAFRSAGRLFKQGDRIIEGERLVLPLASDGIHADGVLGASDYPPTYIGEGAEPVELLRDFEEWFPLGA